MPHCTARKALPLEPGEKAQALAPRDDSPPFDSGRGLEVPISPERSHIVELEGRGIGYSSAGSQAIGGNQHFQGLHERRRYPEKRRSFPDGLHHPREISTGEISETTMNDPQTIGGGGGSEIIPVHHCHR